MTALTSYDGIQQLGDYAAPAANPDKIQVLIDLIPDVDRADDGDGSTAGGGFLDEMSPAAAVQLRVELEAMASAIEGGTGEAYAFGSHTVSAPDASANLVDIVTGLANITLANCVVNVQRGAAAVTGDAVITEPTPGTIRVADGSTYNTTAADVITWAARP